MEAADQGNREADRRADELERRLLQQEAVARLGQEAIVASKAAISASRRTMSN